MSVKDSRPENRLQLRDCFVITRGHQSIYLFNDGIDAGNAILLLEHWIGLYLKQFRIEASIGRQKNLSPLWIFRGSFVGVLLAIPPNRTTPYVLIENAVSPPARLPP